MNSSALYIHIPAHMLPDRLPFLLERQLQPEVACQDVTLDELDFDLLGDCAARLREKGLGTTLHAPYSGFHPGGHSVREREQSRKLADRSLDLAEKLQACRIIFHPGLAYGSDGEALDDWVQQNLAFWPEFMPRAEALNCTICLENIYETTPQIFTRLLEELHSPFIGHVFDIGHWNMFADGKLEDWLDATARYLKHLHLHDNHGRRDEHLAIGRGTVPFSRLFDWLLEKRPTTTITLENHELSDAEQSLRSIQPFLRD